MNVWFDMDGTIVDLYGYNNWLDYLLKEDVTPFLKAKPLINLSRLARLLNQLQKHNVNIGIISWTSKDSTISYHYAIEDAKKKWLHKHLPSVAWNEIKIVSYGENKFQACDGRGMLFDDDERNINNWLNNKAYSPDEIFDVLTNLLNSIRK